MLIFSFTPIWIYSWPLQLWYYPAFILNNSSGHGTKKIKKNIPSFFFFLIQRWYTRVLRLRAKQFSFVYAEIIWYAGLEAVTLWSKKKRNDVHSKWSVSFSNDMYIYINTFILYFIYICVCVRMPILSGFLVTICPAINWIQYSPSALRTLYLPTYILLFHNNACDNTIIERIVYLFIYFFFFYNTTFNIVINTTLYVHFKQYNVMRVLP